MANGVAVCQSALPRTTLAWTGWVRRFAKNTRLFWSRIVLKRGPVLFAGLVLVVTLLVHGPSIFHDFVNWDDDIHVLNNPAVQQPSEVPLWRHLATPELGYPAPVTVATYAIGQAIFGPGPMGFHLVNVLVHCANVLLLFALCLSFGASWTGAMAGALLFAIHPATVEPVAWVSGRKDLLAAFFTLGGGLWLARRVWKSDQAMKARWAIAGLLVLGMLSKPSVALLPALAFLWDPIGRRGPWPVALAACALLVVASFFLESRVGALSGQAPVFVRVPAGLYVHLRSLLWPYDHLPKYLDQPGWPLLLAGAALGILAIGLTLLAVRRRCSCLPGIALAWATYLPVAGLVPLSRQYADTYLYLPLAGLGLALSIFVSALGPRRWLPRVAMALVAAVLGLSAATQVPMWRDGVALWAETWRAYPDSPQVCRNLGNAHLFGRRFEPQHAVAVYRYCMARFDMRDFFLKNLAIATAQSGDLEQARLLLAEALQKRPDDEALRRWASAIAPRSDRAPDVGD